jgi:hypothetical protein
MPWARKVLDVFTTEALRDAAITAPVEGQRAYITASTVAAATGTTTMVPTGIQTIYNGAAWVCVTDVGANTPAQGNVTSLSFTATLTGSPGTNPSVTVATGTTALVSVKSSSGTNNAGYTAFTGVAVSGATTKAATADDCVQVFGNPTFHQIGVTYVITGLTAGTNTFTLQYQVNSGTGQFSTRALTVRGIA